ncbi:uncharacterized protein C1orf159 homolog isoform X3 [Camelus ferus]|uniref:Uncharacterized protein C1orf159 homolog isoform X3 n=1 Tax=Camelus ferus TaxID=419612 RepID=A0A8B8U972_CAMFR|nr:uncharacterized protein C1orf159 homolog isoform X3 [Camelus ferus]
MVPQRAILLAGLLVEVASKSSESVGQQPECCMDMADANATCPGTSLCGPGCYGRWSEDGTVSCVRCRNGTHNSSECRSPAPTALLPCSHWPGCTVPCEQERRDARAAEFRGPSGGSLPLPGHVPRELGPHPLRGHVLLPQACQQTARSLLWKKQRLRQWCGLQVTPVLFPAAPALQPGEAAAMIPPPQPSDKESVERIPSTGQGVTWLPSALLRAPALPEQGAGQRAQGLPRPLLSGWHFSFVASDVSQRQATEQESLASSPDLALTTVQRSGVGTVRKPRYVRRERPLDDRDVGPTAVSSVEARVSNV